MKTKNISYNISEFCQFTIHFLSHNSVVEFCIKKKMHFKKELGRTSHNQGVVRFRVEFSNQRIGPTVL